MDEIYLILIAIIFLILFVATIAWAYRTLYRRKSPKQTKQPSKNGPIASTPKSAAMSHGKSGTALVSPSKVTSKPATPSPEKKSAERIKENTFPEIDLIHDSLSIMESLNRLCQKFSIETCTLASTDGLVIASSFAGGTRDAAYFSNLYLREKITRQGDITISPIRYKNQNLILIIRAQRNLNSEDIEAIKSHEKEILSFWL